MKKKTAYGTVKIGIVWENQILFHFLKNKYWKDDFMILTSFLQYVGIGIVLVAIAIGIGGSGLHGDHHINVGSIQRHGAAYVVGSA